MDVKQSERYHTIASLLYGSQLFRSYIQDLLAYPKEALVLMALRWVRRTSFIEFLLLRDRGIEYDVFYHALFLWNDLAILRYYQPRLSSTQLRLEDKMPTSIPPLSARIKREILTNKGALTTLLYSHFKDLELYFRDHKEVASVLLSDHLFQTTEEKTMLLKMTKERIIPADGIELFHLYYYQPKTQLLANYLYLFGEDDFITMFTMIDFFHLKHLPFILYTGDLKLRHVYCQGLIQKTGIHVLPTDVIAAICSHPQLNHSRYVLPCQEDVLEKTDFLMLALKSNNLNVAVTLLQLYANQADKLFDLQAAFQYVVTYRHERVLFALLNLPHVLVFK